MNRAQLEKHVCHIAEETLYKRKCVSAIDIFLGMGLLTPLHLQEWRRRKIRCLENALQGNLKMFSFVMKCFRQWAQRKGLKTSEAAYTSKTKKGVKIPLRFSVSGNPQIEKAYCTHFVDPAHMKQKKKPPKKKIFLEHDEHCSAFVEPEMLRLAEALCVRVKDICNMEEL